MDSQTSSQNDGRPLQYGEPLDQRKPVMFTKSQVAKIQKAAGPDIDFSAYVRSAAIEKSRPSIKAEVVDLSEEIVSGPVLDVRVACGPPMVADEAASTFVLSRQVAQEISFDPDTDFFIRARGDSMECRGIIDDFVVVLTPLKVGAQPRIGKIALMAFHDEEGHVTGTLKVWNGESNGVPRLLNGAGEPFPLPEGTVKAEPVAIAKGVIGEL